MTSNNNNKNGGLTKNEIEEFVKKEYPRMPEDCISQLVENVYKLNQEKEEKVDIAAKEARKKAEEEQYHKESIYFWGSKELPYPHEEELYSEGDYWMGSVNDDL
jgi:hypothetical protein